MRVVGALPIDIRYLKQENPGAAAARNHGIMEASAELIAFLDVDDLWPENVLGPLVRTLEQNPQYDAVRGFAQIMALNKKTGRFEFIEFIGNPKESYPYYIGTGSIAGQRFKTSACSMPNSNSPRIPTGSPAPGVKAKYREA
jgi:glycosyltransferase involved in cell wall biosynthesis